MYYANIAITDILFILTLFVIDTSKSREISIRVNIPGAQIFQWNYIQNSSQRPSTTSTSAPLVPIPNDETKIHISNEIINASQSQSGESFTEKITSEPDPGLESEDEFLQWLQDNPSTAEKPIKEISDISHHFQNPRARSMKSK